MPPKKGAKKIPSRTQEAILRYLLRVGSGTQSEFEKLSRLPGSTVRLAWGVLRKKGWIVSNTVIRASQGFPSIPGKLTPEGHKILKSLDALHY